MRSILLLLPGIFSFHFLFALPVDSIQPPKQHFELSFGHSLLFLSNSKLVDVKKESAIVVPTSAILFFSEFRPEKKLRIPAFFTIPTESKQFLVNGQLTSERASVTFGSGLGLELMRFRIDDRSRIEFEIAALGSCIFNTHKDLRVVPIGAARFRFRRGENFVMYIGMSFSAGINAMGLLYGTGSIF